MGAQASSLPRNSLQAECLRSPNQSIPSGVTAITIFRPFAVSAALCCAPLLTIPSFAQAPTQDPAQGAAQPAPPPITAQELEKIVGGPPTTVTFSGQKVKLFDAVEVLRKVGGGDLEATKRTNLLSRSDKTVDIAWKDTPFWKAAAQIETVTGDRWSNISGGGVRLLPFGLPGGLGGAVGAQTPYFLVIGTSVQRQSSRELLLNGAPLPEPKIDNILKLRIYADPKVPPATGSLRDCKFQLTEGGTWTEILSSNLKYRPEAPITDRLVSLPDGLKSGTVISRLTGTYNVELVQEAQTWKVPDILGVTNVSETLAGTKFTLKSARFEGNDLKVVISYTMPWTEKGFTGLHQNVRAMKLTDSAGHILASPIQDTKYGFRQDGWVPIERPLTYTATTEKGPIAKGPVTLEWTLPSLTRSFPVPFEFKNVKIP